MTDAGKEIIEFLKKKKTFTLLANKEFWEILNYENKKIININGETLGNTENERKEISKTDALKKIKQYFKQHCLMWENKFISTDTEILEYWKHWKYEH